MHEVLSYLVVSIREYLNDEIQIDAFRSAFVGSYHYIRSNAQEHGGEEAQELASSLIVPFSNFSLGQLSEESFRMALMEAIRPFLPAAGRIQPLDGTRRGARFARRNPGVCPYASGEKVYEPIYSPLVA